MVLATAVAAAVIVIESSVGLLVLEECRESEGQLLVLILLELCRENELYAECHCVLFESACKKSGLVAI